MAALPSGDGVIVVDNALFDAPPPVAPVSTAFCDVCLDTVPSTSMITPRCTHALCLSCARLALLSQLRARSGASDLVYRAPLRCFAGPLQTQIHGCAVAPTEAVVQRLLSAEGDVSSSTLEQLAAAYLLFSTPGAVACARAPACGGFGVVASVAAATAAAGAGGASAAGDVGGAAIAPAVAVLAGADTTPTTPEDVECNTCATRFCSVHGSAHAPGRAPCAAFIAVHDTAENRAASSAVSVLSRPCPRCRAPTDRIAGCRLLTCASCSAPWCWDCGRVLYASNPSQRCMCGPVGPPLTPWQLALLRIFGFLSISTVGVAGFLLHLCVTPAFAPFAALESCLVWSRSRRRRPLGAGASSRTCVGSARSFVSDLAARAYAMAWAHIFYFCHVVNFLTYLTSLALLNISQFTTLLQLQLAAMEEGQGPPPTLPWGRPSLIASSIAFWHRKLHLIPRDARLSVQINSGAVFAVSAARLVLVGLYCFVLFVLSSGRSLPSLPPLRPCEFARLNMTTSELLSANMTAGDALTLLLNATAANTPCSLWGRNITR